jgi:hypothetical protein
MTHPLVQPFILQPLGKLSYTWEKVRDSVRAALATLTSERSSSAIILSLSPEVHHSEKIHGLRHAFMGMAKAHLILNAGTTCRTACASFGRDFGVPELFSASLKSQ